MVLKSPRHILPSNAHIIYLYTPSMIHSISIKFELSLEEIYSISIKFKLSLEEICITYWKLDTDLNSY